MYISIAGRFTSYRLPSRPSRSFDVIYLVPMLLSLFGLLALSRANWVAMPLLLVAIFATAIVFTTDITTALNISL